ncbi:hypothetical protein MNBD_BACTEROID02-255 [hydrothermal vent metagenome]|uniref:Uncharacterized protein n=1 Tax=hydrothermal vent metagenome TaxID=652676 RepID=A0A3B0QSB4_9ZZZZ
MKIILSFLAIILITKDCNNTAVSHNTQEQDIIITYQAASRGSFEEITVSKDSFSISTDRTKKNIAFHKTPTKDWDDLLKLLEVIEINQLPNLKAPTSMRQYDGAAHATLIIKKNAEKIQSNSFDHGYPPKEIKPLVEKLLSFKKLASKQ